MEGFAQLGLHKVTIYGEAYGGKIQGMSATYGKELQFIGFDVLVQVAEDSKPVWLSVPQAEDIVVERMGLEFVPYEKGPSTVEWLESQKMADSIVALRRGMGAGHIREGIVIRPLEEMIVNNEHRVIAKFRRDEFRETKSKRIVDDNKPKLIEDARTAADEWCVPNRLIHVLDKLPGERDLSLIKTLIPAMLEDIYREGAGELLDNKETRKEIGNRTVHLYKLYLAEQLRANEP